MAKRNIKALKRLRAVFAKVPAHKVHMGVAMEEAVCGTVGCLWGWGRIDPELREMGAPYPFREGAVFLGLDWPSAKRLFAIGGGDRAFLAFERNPHAVSKAQVLASLDDAIAGRPIKPYVIKSA